jgi:hypothetical protein
LLHPPQFQRSVLISMHSPKGLSSSSPPPHATWPGRHSTHVSRSHTWLSGHCVSGPLQRPTLTPQAPQLYRSMAKSGQTGWVAHMTPPFLRQRHLPSLQYPSHAQLTPQAPQLKGSSASEVQRDPPSLTHSVSPAGQDWRGTRAEAVAAAVSYGGCGVTHRG